MSKSKIQPSHINIRSVYLPTEFIRNNLLKAKTVYPIYIAGVLATDLEGTLQTTNMIGGVSPLYTILGAKADDDVELSFQNGALHLSLVRNGVAVPPPAKPVSTAVPDDPVFERQKLRHLHFDAFNPASFLGWTPQGEPDVYFVFGNLQEFTDYRYCCATSQAILDQLGYKAGVDGFGKSFSKPDTILIERATSQYLIAEFKMNSKDFKSNHGKDDVDVLVCWDDDEIDRTVLPPQILCLQKKLSELVASGELAE